MTAGSKPPGAPAWPRDWLVVACVAAVVVAVAPDDVDELPQPARAVAQMRVAEAAETARVRTVMVCSFVCVSALSDGECGGCDAAVGCAFAVDRDGVSGGQVGYLLLYLLGHCCRAGRGHRVCCAAEVLDCERCGAAGHGHHGSNEHRTGCRGPCGTLSLIHI